MQNPRWHYIKSLEHVTNYIQARQDWARIVLARLRQRRSFANDLELAEYSDTFGLDGGCFTFGLTWKLFGEELGLVRRVRVQIFGFLVNSEFFM